MPTGFPETIVSILELFDGSGLVEEQPREKPWPENWIFAYGKFIGKNDGKPKLGIERKSYVRKLK